MKNLILFLSGVIPLIVLTGCGTTAKFVYPPRMKDIIQVAQAPVYNSKVAVQPFDDYRSDENTSGTFWMYLVPLWPFGWVTYERPDAARMFVSIASFDFTPSEDLPKAAAVSLRRSNLFEDAFFTYGGEKSDADLLFSGKIISTKYYGRIFGYGIPLEGPLLWILGAPAGTSSNRLALKFTLSRIKDKKVIWEYAFDREDYIVQWIYARMGHDVRDYAKLMSQAMNEAIRDLSARLAASPNLLIP